MLPAGSCRRSDAQHLAAERLGVLRVRADGGVAGRDPQQRRRGRCGCGSRSGGRLERGRPVMSGAGLCSDEKPAPTVKRTTRTSAGGHVARVDPAVGGEAGIDGEPHQPALAGGDDVGRAADRVHDTVADGADPPGPLGDEQRAGRRPRQVPRVGEAGRDRRDVVADRRRRGRGGGALRLARRLPQPEGARRNPAPRSTRRLGRGDAAARGQDVRCDPWDHPPGASRPGARRGPRPASVGGRCRSLSRRTGGSKRLLKREVGTVCGGSGRRARRTGRES